jgi:hypothetical protein
MTRAPKGGYSSGVEVNGQTFTATYLFDNPVTAQIAAGGGMRAMAWQNQDIDGNRQGLTISERARRPRHGRLPGGPAQQGPRSPTNVTVTSTGADTAVRWTAPTPTPGTAPILGYTVRAVSQLSTDGAQGEIGKRISNASTTTATLPTTLAGERVEVRSYSETGESWPPAILGSGASGDAIAPTVSASPAGGSFTADQTVSLTANEPNSQIYYTTDRSDPLEADAAGLKSTLYTDPIVIAARDANGQFVAPVNLRFVAFDPAGNASLAKAEAYSFGATRSPVSPTIASVQPGNTSATVQWTAPVDPGTSPITGYVATATPMAGSGPAVTANTGPNASTVQLSPLVNGTKYAVTVSAVNAVGSGTSSAAAPVTPVAPATDTLTVTTAKWKAP